MEQAHSNQSGGGGASRPERLCEGAPMCCMCGRALSEPNARPPMQHIYARPNFFTCPRIPFARLPRPHQDAVHYPQVIHNLHSPVRCSLCLFRSGCVAYRVCVALGQRGSARRARLFYEPFERIPLHACVARVITSDNKRLTLRIWYHCYGKAGT